MGGCNILSCSVWAWCFVISGELLLLVFAELTVSGFDFVGVLSILRSGCLCTLGVFDFDYFGFLVVLEFPWLFYLF